MTQWDLTNNAELCFDCSQKKTSGTANCAGQKKDAGARVLWAVMLESRREKHLCLPTCKGLVYAFNCTDFICTSIVSMLVQAGKMAIHVKTTHTHRVSLLAYTSHFFMGNFFRCVMTPSTYIFLMIFDPGADVQSWAVRFGSVLGSIAAYLRSFSFACLPGDQRWLL